MRLEVSNFQRWHIPLLCFNSLLVRLEACIHTKPPLRFVVSIPYWCDWKLRQKGIPFTTEAFQFLIGAIGRKEFRGTGMFDFAFQFLIGAIGRTTSLAANVFSVMFQFLIGAIGR